MLGDNGRKGYFASCFSLTWRQNIRSVTSFVRTPSAAEVGVQTHQYNRAWRGGEMNYYRSTLSRIIYRSRLLLLCNPRLLKAAERNAPGPSSIYDLEKPKRHL